MATVLCTGSDSFHTRHLLLKSAGFDVVTATTKHALLTARSLAHADAVILDSRSNIPDLPTLASELKTADPSLPVILVADAGTVDVPEPAVVFDRVISRLDGPTALLDTLRELTTDVVYTSEVTTSSARATRGHIRQLRQGMVQLRAKLRQLPDTLSTTVHLIRKS